LGRQEEKEIFKMAKNWGKIDKDGKLIGKPRLFPPDEVKEGERVSYTAVIPHNSANNPEKFYYDDVRTTHLGDTYCMAIFTPESPVGHWTITIWGPKTSIVTTMVRQTMKDLGLA
jgi:hypothetical protein